MILAVPSRQSVADSIGPCDILSILLAPIAHASCDNLSPILMAAPLRRPAVDSLAAPLRAPRGDWPQIRSAVPSRIPCFFTTPLANALVPSFALPPSSPYRSCSSVRLKRAPFQRHPSRRRAIIDCHRADGRPSILFAPTGDHRDSSRRRAIIKILRADGRSSIVIAPTGDHQFSSRRRVIIDYHRADGRLSIIIALTGDHLFLRVDGRSSIIIAPTGNLHILSRRRAFIDHQSSRRRAIINHHCADGRSAYPIAPTGNHRSSIIFAPTGDLH